ncbi:unnamed protein product [Ectocarpus sp. 13 AM-2016]
MKRKSMENSTADENAYNGEQVSVNGVEPMLVDSDRTSTTEVTNVSTDTDHDANSADCSREGQQQQGGQGQEVEEDPSQRWRALEKLVSRPSPFGNETGQLAVGEFEPFENMAELLEEELKVLVIGAGGLGCELLKDLALSAITDITVIDMDSIDVSNLNRQFLFRQKDVGRPKATVAAEAIMARVKGCKVEAHHAKIQDFDADFYREFRVVISGLDNVEARRWLNSMLCSLVELGDDGSVSDPTTIIPLIDGGTEGFKGQARVILPQVTSCFECSLDMFPPQKVFPMCTIAETPRMPEHCISYAMLILWPKEFPDKKLDNDDPQHMKWVCEQAKERAEAHGIAGVTYELTLGVVKNIIPAVASTNAIIAASCTNEAVKILTGAGQTMNTYMMYNGMEGTHGSTMVVDKKEDCLVCGTSQRTVEVKPSSALADLVETLGLKDPSLTRPGLVLYMPKPPALRRQTEQNLKKTLGELCSDGDVLTVTEGTWASNRSLSVILRFTK